MKDTELYRQLLGISSPWKVERVELDHEALRIDVRLGHKKGVRWECPKCERLCGLQGHAEERSWRHLDSCQFETRIHAQIPRVRCPEHGVCQVRVPWADPKARFTLLFEALAIRVLKETSVSGGAKLLGISWDEAHGIMKRAVERGLDAREELDLRVIGVDEKYAGRGRGFLTLIYDIRGGRVVDIEDGRKKTSLGDFFLKLEPQQLARIEAMAMDMAKPYISAAEEALPCPESTIVFDRFHVMQAMTSAVDQVRRAENKALLQADDRRLVGSMHVLRYSEENLPERHRDKLDELKDSKLKTARAWALKEMLRELWTQSDVDEALALWKRWHCWATRCQLGPVKKVAKMVKSHLPGILSYYTHRLTNAFSEGINGVIEGIKNTARGYRNLENFKTAIFFHCGGLKLENLALASG